MGHWDRHGIELRAGETAESLVQALPRSHGFHANGVFAFRDTQWVHVGWDDANAVAYRALVHFCLTSDRCWITIREPARFSRSRWWRRRPTFSKKSARSSRAP